MKNILFSFLYISVSMPIAFLLLGLPLILQLEGFSSVQIGLFQLAGLPYIFVFLFAPIVDGLSFKNNHYKKWIFILGIVYTSVLLYISFLSIKDDYYLVFTFMMLVVLFSTFLEIPLNALAVKSFKKGERTTAASFKSASYFISAILGNGIIIIIYNHYSWKTTFICMSLFFLVSMLSLIFIKESQRSNTKASLPYKEIIRFFKQKDILNWILILSFYFVFISPVWMFMKPYLLTKGFSPDTVALLVGVYGGIIGSLGSLSTVLFKKYFSNKTLLIIFTCVNIFVMLLFVFIEKFDLSQTIYILLITIMTISMAVASAILFSYMMTYTRSEYRAIDYSVQNSLFSFTRMIFAVLAGVIIQYFSYLVLFIFSGLGMFLVLIILYFYKERN